MFIHLCILNNLHLLKLRLNHRPLRTPTKASRVVIKLYCKVDIHSSQIASLARARLSTEYCIHSKWGDTETVLEWQLQRKHRRGTSGESKQGRKKEVKEEKGEKRKTKHLFEVDADKEVIVDEAGRWESVNGYKVLRATTSKVPTYSEAVYKMDADSSTDLIREFERERAETEKAKSIWDGKLRPKKKHFTEGSEAYLQIKASVSSSVAGSEETPEGVKVREVVKRSTLLPIPSGDESEVHSSVYNVRETDQGLTVEEVVTRTKLLPAKGDFSLSDQQLLKRTYRKKPVRQDVLRFLPLVLRIVAVLVTLFSVLLLLFSKKRIPFPFFH